jgi:hypothetical protein
MIADKDLMVAKYIPERTKNGYVARIRIELVRASGEKHDLDYLYPCEFAKMNDALAKAFQLVGPWRARYAPDVDVVIPSESALEWTGSCCGRSFLASSASPLSEIPVKVRVVACSPFSYQS